MNTYHELLDRKEKGEDIVIEYEDCVVDDKEEFVEATIISPHNQQHTLIAYVPESMAQELEDERELVATGQYHDWTSKYTEFSRMVSEKEMDSEDIDYYIEEYMNDWNATPLGKRHLLERSDFLVELVGTGLYVDWTSKYIDCSHMVPVTEEKSDFLANKDWDEIALHVSNQRILMNLRGY